jgi:signal peptidase
MKGDKRLTFFLRAALTLVLLGVAWITLAPSRFGGRSAYVIVTGNSMEPNLNRDDLIVLRETHDYQIGDVVAYSHPYLGPVIHRIIGLEGSRYILQGDNNDWTDSYQPAEADIIGEMWIHLPQAGRAVQNLRSPLGASLLAGLAALILLWPDSKSQSEEERTVEEEWREVLAFLLPTTQTATNARRNGMTREQAEQLIAGLQEIGRKLVETPTLLWQKGKLVAHDPALPRALATELAWQAWNSRPEKSPAGPAREWMDEYDVWPSRDDEPESLTHYSVVVAKSLTLTVPCDVDVPLVVLRARALEAAAAMRDLVEATLTPQEVPEAEPDSAGGPASVNGRPSKLLSVHGLGDHLRSSLRRGDRA